MDAVEKHLRGISDDTLEAAARLVERLGKLQNLRMISAEHFAVLAAADIRLLKYGSHGERPQAAKLDTEG